MQLDQLKTQKLRIVKDLKQRLHVQYGQQPKQASNLLGYKTQTKTECRARVRTSRSVCGHQRSKSTLPDLSSSLPLNFKTLTKTSGESNIVKFKEMKPRLSAQAIAREQLAQLQIKELHARVFYQVKEGMIFKAHERTTRTTDSAANKAQREIKHVDDKVEVCRNT